MYRFPTLWARLAWESPLWPAAVGAALGIVIDDAFTPHLLDYGLILAAAVTVVVIARRCGTRCAAVPSALVGVVLAGVALGGVHHDGTVRRPRDGGCLARLSRARPARVDAVVATPPVVDSGQSSGAGPLWGERTRFTVSVEAIDGRRATGRIQVTVYDPVRSLNRGDRITVYGKLAPLRGPRNPGAYDWRKHQRRKGISARMTVKFAEQVVRRASAPRTGWQRMSNAMRGLARRALFDGGRPDPDEPGTTLLDAMILGRRGSLDRTLNEQVIRAGAAHFVTVSGLHLAIPMSIAWWFAWRFGFGRVGAALAMAAAVTAYLMIAESRPPIVRASVMAYLFVGSVVLGRGRAGLNWLAAAGLIMLMAVPALIWSVGFQLSFCAVAGIMLLPPVFAATARSLRERADRIIYRSAYAVADRRLRDDLARRRSTAITVTARRLVTHWLVAPAGVSMAAWMACGPVVAWHFGKLHTWSVVASLVLWPMAFGIVGLGFVGMLGEAMVPGTGAAVRVLISPLERWFADSAGALAAWPAAVIDVPHPSLIWMAGYGSWCLIWLLRGSCESTSSTRTLRAVGSFLCIIMPVGLAIAAGRAGESRQLPVGVKLTVLDVGAGAAAVVELPDGAVYMFDCGGGRGADVGRSVALPFLAGAGIDRLDGIFISHANLDHYSGVVSVIDALPCKEILVNRAFLDAVKQGGPVARCADRLDRRGLEMEVVSPGVFTVGDVRFEVLDSGAAEMARAVNDRSMVVRLHFQGRSILLPGDVEQEALAYLLASGTDLRADVLILPHHGSVERATGLFLRAVDPLVAVRSSHEPTAETINGLGALAGSIPIYNTADHGAIVVEVGPGGPRVTMPCAARSGRESP